jgi:4-amino-4-deoxy-L-arabinose transferase-like glycosyltransferase
VIICVAIPVLVPYMVDANVFLPYYTLLYAILLAGAGAIPNACCKDGGAQGWNASCFCKS